jgi:cell division protein FtsZ
MAISNPLLDDVTMKGAKGVLINITGGPDLMLFEVEQAANRIRAEVDPDANIIFGNTILPEMEGRIRVSVVATGIDADLVKMPLPTEKVRTLHPHLNIRNRMAETPRPAPVPQPAPPQYHPAAANPVHATMDVLANQIGAEKSPAEDYILGGADAPQVPQTEVAAVRYPAVESRRSLEQQPMAAGHVEPPKKGWSIFGRKKTAGDVRAEPMPEALRAPAPRATAQVMPPQPAPQLQPQDLPRNNADDLFPDHKRDEQFEIPAFLRRQSN